MYKIIIAGSRDFLNYKLLEKECDEFIEQYQSATEHLPYDDIGIISGNARGADKLGEQYAKENNYKCYVMPADWNKHGKSAGYIRNADMAKEANALIVFWDGKSKGTNHMIQLAKQNYLTIKIVLYKDLL